MSMTLADILAPLSPERFFAEYYDQQPLHLPGAAEKFAAVLDWGGINRLLGMTHIWSERKPEAGAGQQFDPARAI